MLDVAVSSDVSSEQLSSWVLAAFGFGGLLSIVCSLVYRMPMGLAWTIPGSILLGGALEHLPYEQCIGAFVVTAGVITSWASRDGWKDRCVDSTQCSYGHGRGCLLALRAEGDLGV